MQKRVTAWAAWLALAAGLSGCRAPDPAAPAQADEAARPVSVAVVERAGGATLDAAPGVVAARRRAVLAARTPGTVMELPFREGARVAAGTVVVRLDDAALRSAEAAASADTAAAEADAARAAALLGRGAVTARERDQASARAAAARAGLAAARESLGYAALRAPFAGVVAERPVNVGDVVGPGAPLLVLEGEDGLEVRATVDGAQAARLAPGATLSVEVDGLAAPLPAVVRSIAPAADPVTHRVEVRADLAPARGVRSGLAGVFVVDGGRARLRWIALGAAHGETFEVRAGVEEGERVILDPGPLMDGARVEPRP
jgi:RND family efflux transporter MFP subunit